MMVVSRGNGDFVKVINNFSGGVYGVHSLFGFISEDNFKKRLITRQKRGYSTKSSKWLCRFEVSKEVDQPKLTSLENCEVTQNGAKWSIVTGNKEFILAQESVNPFVFEEENNEISEEKKWLLLSILVVILFGIISNYPSNEIKEEDAEKIIEPVTVKIIEQNKVVNVARSNPSIKAKPLTKTEQAHRAVKKNLGFLGLIGKKDLTKAVGGLPTKLNKATAGAGAGGDAGSGGEVLKGLGKGLKRTTVGNTGVQGLGGIGTKGAGGGAGGYGNAVVASGEGRGISAIAVSNNMVLEGGLDRYVIQATIAKYLSQVRRCYESELVQKPGLAGQIDVNFQINNAGNLNFSKVTKSSLGNKTVENCVTNKMMTWKFPKPKGGVDVNVNYPFLLRPVSL